VFFSVFATCGDGYDLLKNYKRVGLQADSKKLQYCNKLHC
jgi:hypothetical protein